VRTRIILIVSILSAPLLAGGCGSTASGGPKTTTKVVAAFYPLAFAAEQIGGRHVSVENLTPAGAEPHDLEISPKSVADIQSADLVLLLGHGFQKQVESAAGDGKHVLLLLDTPGLHRFASGDPHVWLDPVRYALIAERIGKALHRPAATGAFVRRLEALDSQYKRGLAHCARREIITSHQAFGYLGQRYHLNQVAITGLTPESEATPRDLEHVIETARQTHATTVYFERLVSPRLADTVAREAGAKTDVLDPIEGLAKGRRDSGESYFTLMRQNLAALRRGLGCR
jgi:zinc transport system substrate-binding protein